MYQKHVDLCPHTHVYTYTQTVGSGGGAGGHAWRDHGAGDSDA